MARRIKHAMITNAPVTESYTTPAKERKTQVRWVKEEHELLGKTMMEVWLVNPGMSFVEMLNKAQHKCLPQHRWRHITSALANSPEAVEHFTKLHTEFLAQVEKPLEVITISTKELVMLPPEQCVQHIETELLMSEVARRLGSIMRKLDNVQVPTVQPSNGFVSVQKPQPPRVLTEDQSRECKRIVVAFIGPLRAQFEQWMGRDFNAKITDPEHAQYGEYLHPLLRERVKPIWLEKDQSKIDFGYSVLWVFRTKHSSHYHKEQALAQGKNEKFIGTLDQAIKFLYDVVSRTPQQ